MANNKLYKTSIAMTALIATLGSGLAANTAVADTAPATAITAPAPDKTTQPDPDGSKTEQAATPVIKIGDTEYKTLAEAVAAAKEGDTITVAGHLTGNTTIDKKITLQGVEGNQVNGTITVTAKGATITGVNFLFDKTAADMGDGATDLKGAALSQLAVKADDVTVANNTFTITRDANTTRQLNAVWVQNAKNTTLKGNTFTIATHARYLTDKTPSKTDSWSWVAVNLVGGVDKDGNATVQNVTLDGNTLTMTEGDRLAADKLPDESKGKNLSGQVNLLVSNGNNSEKPGVTGVTATNNKQVNSSKLSADDSNLYGLTLMGTVNTTVKGNTFDGYVAVATSKWGKQSPATGLSYTGNTDNTSKGVSFAKDSYTGPVDYKNNTGTNKSSQLVSTGDASYLTLQEALDASKDGKLTLQGDIKSDPVNIAKDKTVSIDLNGHALTADLTNEGDLTVTDSTESGKLDGKLDGTGKLTLTGGTYTFKPADGTVPAGYAVVTNEKDKTYTVVALKLNVPNSDVTYDVKGGELDADKVIALTGAVAPTGYEVIVPQEALDQLNAAIKAGAKKDVTVGLQLGKDGKPVEGVDPVDVTVHVVSTSINVTITVRSGELTVNAGDGQYTAAQLLEKAGATATGEADLQVNAEQLNKLNDAIVANKAGDYQVGLTAVKDGITAVSAVTVHLQAATLTANGFDWNVNDGELTADKVLELAKPAVSGSDYTLDVNADQLGELNKAIKDNKTGKVTITITATGTGRPQLVAALDVNLTTKNVDTTTGKLAQTGTTILSILGTTGILAAAAAAITLVRKRIAD